MRDRQRGFPRTGKHNVKDFFTKNEPVRLQSPPLSWRAWHLIENRLQSLTSKHIWQGPVMTTEMLENGVLKKVRKNHDKNGINSHLEDWGIYSYKTPTLLLSYLSGFQVYGRIENWNGMEHEFGYRSQKVVVQELWLWGPLIVTPKSIAIYQEIADEMEQVYHCPVSLMEQRKVAVTGLDAIYESFLTWWPLEEERKWLNK